MAIQSRLFRYENETPMEIVPYTIRGLERRVPTTRGTAGDLILIEERGGDPRDYIHWRWLSVERYYPIFEIGFHLGIWPENNYDKSRFQIVVYKHINN